MFKKVLLQLAVASVLSTVPSWSAAQTPVITQTPTTITVAWDPPTLNEDGTPVSVIGYVLERKLSNSPNYLLFAVVGKETTSIKLDTSKLAQCFRVRTIGEGWIMSVPSERACRAATP